jgi:hypothetical protein
VDLENQLARKAATEKRRRHAQREAVEFDVVLDLRDGKRSEQQQGKDYDRGRVIL